MIFADRAEAGRKLAQALEPWRSGSPVVLALPRGGVPVGAEVARALGCPLDLVMVRKIGLPWQPELALGAVVGSEPPEMVVNPDILALVPTAQDYLREERDRQLAEIERHRRLYLGGRRPEPLEGRTAIVVDDGIATGATMLAVLRALRRARPRQLVLAVPVAPSDTLERLKAEADAVVALETPDPFAAVGMHYQNFDQISDQQVVDLLAATG